MKKKNIILIALLVLIMGGQVFGQTVNTRQLDEVMNNGNVNLVSANGTGNIGSVAGRLRNNTASDILVNININNGLYLANSGPGQNMLVHAVYNGDSTYNVSGAARFIRLPANSTSNVVFSALCANRTLPTPQQDHSFTLASMPSDLQRVSSTLSRYNATNSNRNFTAMQLALWRSQGNSALDIMENYSFTQEDWNASSNILGIVEVNYALSGTYAYNHMYSFSISESSFSLNWGGTIYTGAYSRISNVLLLQPSGRRPFIFLVNNSNELMDMEDDIWRRL